MPIVFSALMCHAPIVHPAVGGAEAGRCARTTRAMREVAARVVGSRPDRVVLASPHSPRRRREWGAWAGPHRGNLGQFRAPQAAVDLPDAPEVARALGLGPVDPRPLDHGAMVPLAFLWEAGWRGPTAILALPWEDAPDGPERVGRALAALDGPTAVVASGDMSHRLIPGAPAGHHPRAMEFDQAFVAALEALDWAAAAGAEPRELAAEDVVETARMAMAAAVGPRNAEVLAYEGPWGVGYTEAVFYDEAPPLYVIARGAASAFVRGLPFAPPDGGPGSGGVFVTLRKDGELRGCIGHIEPCHGRLYEEIADVARSAATRDPRFPRVRPEELGDLGWEVSVLEPPEDIAGPHALDPRRYGVIIASRDDPRRRGVLLPDIEGVDTVDEQIAIARRKAGVSAREAVVLQRFVVRKEAQP